MGQDCIWFDECPSMFQRFMEHCFEGYRDKFAVTYLNDLLIYSATFEGYLDHLRLVLKRLKKHYEKVKASKCSLFKKEISYLRRIISAAGYTTGSKDIIAMLSKVRKKPASISEL